MFKKILSKVSLLLSCVTLFTVAQAAGTGTLTITTVDKDIKPVKGFVYELENEDTKEKQTIDMKDSTEKEIELKYGKYKISEVTTPEKFQKADDFRFEISGEKNKPNIVKYSPKHIEKKLVEITDKEKYTQTNGLISPVLFYSLGAISIVGLAVLLKKKKAQ